ncbi:NlpC/P60 family protein, partial [Alphaproteobacteria bacterium]|nr:NlpC/P60 family protein [Alphaproteobacteria bacterium]
MQLKIKQIIKNICPIYKEPNNECSLESELLFGEYFYIKRYKDDWVLGNNYNDDYEGWIELRQLAKRMPNQYKVFFLQSLIYKKPNIKSKVLFNLFLGSKVTVVNTNNNWSEIRIDNENNTGFIHTKSILPYSFKINDWVSVAEKFLGVPYKWGGKSLLGIDCSGLVQTAIQLKDNYIPRNTKEQIKMNFDTVQNQNELKRGDLIFWDGHVGIMQNKKNIIHANQYHMQVFSEPLFSAIERIKEKTKE